MVHDQYGDFGQDGFGHNGGLGQGGPHRHRRYRPRRRLPLLGLGVTGAGMAAVALAVMVGVGQLTGGQAACASALSSSALSSSALSLSALTARAQSVSGIATHYVLTGLPNCSYPTPPANGLFVALSPSEYDGAAGCGGYLSVTGPDGSVTVQVIDQCPECATGHIDLSEAAFARLAPLSAGLINVHYQYLANPALPGPITMEVKQGSSQYWLALLADNTGNPLAAVAVETASGGWLSLSRANYNFWIAQSGAGSGPFTVRLTDNQGHQVTVQNIGLDPGAVQSTGTYMYGAGGTQPPPVPTSSSAAPPPASATTASSPAATSATSGASGASGASAAAGTSSVSPSPKSASPSHSPTAHPSRTPTAKRKRAPAPAAAPPANATPTPAPTAPPTC